jgi:RND family efflux transporter MFP subunit
MKMQRNTICLFSVQCLTVIFLSLLLPVQSYSSQLIYTVQTGSFLQADDAQKLFDYGLEKLDERQLAYMRIEKIGRFYSVRLGKFDDHSLAEELRMAIAHAFADTAVIHAYIKDERIITSYSLSPAADKEMNLEKSQPGAVPDKMHSIPQKVARNEEEVSFREALLKKVAYAERTFSPLPDEQLYEHQDEGIMAVTIPSADVVLSFIQPGRIASVHVKEGDLVRENQVLVRQDSAAENEQLMMIKEESEDMTQIESQKASLTQKKEYLKSLIWAAERGSATEAEIEDAKLDVKIAELSLKSAEFNHEQSKRRYREAKIRFDNMTVRSPLSGRVNKVEVEVGESINSLTNAVRVVKTEPLWVDVHVPFEDSDRLKVNQTAQVIFPDSGQETVTGTVIFISTVADAASSTLRVRIEIPNNSHRPAGQQVRVLLFTQMRAEDGRTINGKI